MIPKEFIDFIERQTWINAKRYTKKAPHEYLVKQKLSPEDQEIFVEFVIFIRNTGYKRKFNNTKYTYCDIGIYKYWTMGDRIENTIILNRTNITDRKLDV